MGGIDDSGPAVADSGRLPINSFERASEIDPAYSPDWGGLPGEVVEALSVDGGYTMLLRGGVGSGKTTLALDILSRFQSSVFASTRDTASSLKAHFNWLEDNERVRVLSPSDLRGLRRMLVGQEMTRKHLLDREEIQFTTGSGNLRQAFEERWGSTLELTEAAKVLVHLILCSQFGVVALDRWRGFEELDDEPQNTEQLGPVVIEAARTADVKLIIISEDPTSPSLDHLVDGIISLRDGRITDKTIRYMDFVKIRGLKRRKPSYLYTLEGGRFRTVLEFPGSVNPKAQFEQSIIDTGSRISSGHEGVDGMLGGGFEENSLNVIELGSDTGRPMYEWLAFSIAHNALSNNRPLFLVSNSDVGLSRFNEVLVQSTDDPSLIRNASFLVSGRPTEFTYHEGEDKVHYIESEDMLENYLRKMSKKDFPLSKAVILRLGSFNTRMRGRRGTNVIFSEGSGCIPPRNERSAHLKLLNVNGYLILYGILPHTPAFAVESVPGKSVAPRLIPLS
jgi:KaiC/GvpD/RAD55 family RecA-like ATPase